MKKINVLGIMIGICGVIMALIVYSDNQDLKYKIETQKQEINYYKSEVQNSYWRCSK